MSNLLLSIGRFERGEGCSEDGMRWERICAELRATDETAFLVGMPTQRLRDDARVRTTGDFLGLRPTAADVLEILEDPYYDTDLTECRYLVIGQTILDHAQPGREGPYAALREWLPRHPEFVVADDIEEMFAVTFNPYGWLRRVG